MIGDGFDLSVVEKLRARAQEESWALRVDSHQLRRMWQDYAACKGMPLAAFFGHHASTEVTKAKSVCRRCPVRLDCLTEAIEEDQLCPNWCFGMRGGFSGKARNRMKRRLITKESAACVDVRTMVR